MGDRFRGVWLQLLDCQLLWANQQRKVNLKRRDLQLRGAWLNLHAGNHRACSGINPFANQFTVANRREVEVDPCILDQRGVTGRMLKIYSGRTLRNKAISASGSERSERNRGDANVSIKPDANSCSTRT